MKVIVLGPPGTGKGTYTQRLLECYDVPHISTGDLFRENVKNQTALGKKVEELMKTGSLISDDITLGMVKDRLQKDDAKKGYFFDGFPRTIHQAEEFDKLDKVDAVLYFTATDDVIINRISGRRTCKDCKTIYHITNIPTKVEGVCDKCGGETYQRDDEKPEIVKERLIVYRKETFPLVDYYKAKGVLFEIDANTDINNPNFHVLDDCKKVLDPIYAKTNNAQNNKQ